MKKIVLMSMAMMATSMMQAQGLQYPKAEKDGTVDEYFGVKVSDPYRWLENDTSEATAAAMVSLGISGVPPWFASSPDVAT